MRLFDHNPRTITRKQYKRLQETLDELGDLSGIVHDLNSDQIIGGNQRSTVFDVATMKPVITEELTAPNRQGTIARGYVEWHGERFAYRAVRWTEEQCRKGNITANIAGGDWNWDELAGWSNLPDWGFDEERLRGWNADGAALATMLGIETDNDDQSAGIDVIDSQFSILIECESEIAQADLLERFNAEGLKCRALIS